MQKIPHSQGVGFMLSKEAQRALISWEPINNGERFVTDCADNALVIGGLVFPHKDIHKATWVYTNHTMENKIDHIGPLGIHIRF